MSNWQDSYVETNGIRIHYHRTGGENPPLLLLHGITDNGLCWTRVARALESDYDILMVDARGHGLSDKPQEGYLANDYAADFAGLIEALGIGPVLAMGHSLGAINAATLAANHPQLVRAAVLEDPPWFDLRTNPGRSMEQEATDMSGWRASLIAQQQQPLAEIIAAGKERSPKWSEDEFPAWAESKKQVNPSVLDVGILRTWDDLAPKIQCPTLLVTGDSSEGGIVTQPLATHIADTYPTIAHVHIPHAGHSIRRDQFDTFAHIAKEFLSKFA